MREHPTVLLVGSTTEREAVVRAALGDHVALRAVPGTIEATAESLEARVALVDLGADLEVGMEALAALHRGGRSEVIALGASKEPELILKAMRAGAQDFVALGPGSIGSAELLRVVADRAQRAAAGPGGQIVVVFPAKGGMGATTIAANLGVLLAGAGKSVVLVDLDPHLGDLAVLLDVTPSYTIGDVLRNRQRLDKELLMGSLARHRSGAWVLAHADRLEDADGIGQAELAGLLALLARHFDYVICDGVHSFDENAIAALDAADRLLLVLTQDVPALRNARRCIDVFRRLGYHDDKLRLVVNRYERSRRVDLDLVRETLGSAIHATVPLDSTAATRAVDRGVLLVELSPHTRVVEGLRRLLPLCTVESTAPRRGLWSRLLHREAPSGAPVIPVPGVEHEPQRSTESV